MMLIEAPDILDPSFTARPIHYHNHFPKISLHFPSPGKSFWYQHTLSYIKMLWRTTVSSENEFSTNYCHKFINRIVIDA